MSVYSQLQASDTAQTWPEVAGGTLGDAATEPPKRQAKYLVALGGVVVGGALLLWLAARKGGSSRGGLAGVDDGSDYHFTRAIPAK
jgi:hypothetical protein